MRHGRRSLTAIVDSLLLVFVAVGAGIIIYSFFHSIQKGLTTSASEGFSSREVFESISIENVEVDGSLLQINY